MPPGQPLAELIARNQQTLVEFLQADLELASTFIDLAKTERRHNESHAREVLAKAKKAIEAVRHFLPRVEDPQIAAGIGVRLDQVEAEFMSSNAF